MPSKHLYRFALCSVIAAVLVMAGCKGFWTPRTDNITTSSFAFVTNFNGGGTGSISAFTVNSSTGALTAINSPVNTGSSGNATGAVAIIVLSGKFLYVANDGGSVSVFTWDTTSGQLTAVSGSPFSTTILNPTALVVDHSGKFLYVAGSGSNQVDGFTINTTTGALSEISGMPITLADSPEGIAAHPSLNTIYAAINGTGVAVMTINTTTGLLSAPTNIAPLAGGTSKAIVISRNGKFAYVANGLSSGGVEAWKIDQTTGTLTTPVNATPYPAHDTPVALATDVTGNFLVVVNNASDDVSFYSMDTSGGGLTTISSSITVVTSSSVSPALSGVGIDPTGAFVYVTVIDSTPATSGSAGVSIPGVVGFTLNSSNKTLTAISNGNVLAGNNPTGIVLP